MTTNKTTALIDAAKAVVDRWDSPNWGGRNLEHTADYINRLRKALAAFEHPEQEHPASLSKEAQPASMQHAAPVDAQSGGGRESQVREMSVEGVAQILYESRYPFRWDIASNREPNENLYADAEQCRKDAKALAKLGTIRVVEG